MRWPRILRRREPRSSRSKAGRGNWTGRWPTRLAPSRPLACGWRRRLRESERYQTESRTLRESFAARDATIGQVLHSLGERDAQLSRAASGTRQDRPCARSHRKIQHAAGRGIASRRARANSLALDLQSSRETVASLDRQIKRAVSEANAARAELAAMKSRRILISSSCDRANGAAASIRICSASWMLRSVRRMWGRALWSRSGIACATECSPWKRSSWRNWTAAQTEEARLTSELASRDRAIVEERERGSGDAQRLAKLHEAAELRQAEQTTQIAQLRGEQAAQIARLQSEAETREQEIAVLMAHLQEARRPIQVDRSRRQAPDRGAGRQERRHA